jgi:hypothetical protein
MREGVGEVPPTSIEEVAVRLRHLADTASEQGGPKAAEAMGRVLMFGIQTNELRRYSHPAGTPTPSPKGEPPARISGTLARSMRQEPASGARKIGTHKYQVVVGPTVVYGRIHELGGWAGPGHRTYIPRRPYINPAVIRLRHQISDAGIRAFAKEIGA